MTEILELFDRVWSSHQKNVSMSNYKHAWNKFKNRNSHSRNKRLKEEPNGNFGTEKYHNFFNSINGVNSRMKEKRAKSMNWRKNNRNYCLNNKKKIDWKK